MHIQIHTDTKASKCYIKKKKYHRSFSRFMSDVVENRETERLKHKKKKKIPPRASRNTTPFLFSQSQEESETRFRSFISSRGKGGGGGREEEVRRERVSSVNK